MVLPIFFNDNYSVLVRPLQLLMAFMRAVAVRHLSGFAAAADSYGFERIDFFFVWLEVTAQMGFIAMRRCFCFSAGAIAFGAGFVYYDIWIVPLFHSSNPL
jgi:hypothetical protein